MHMKSELLKHCREALPMLTKIENDLKWLETEFNPAKATAEERMYAKYLSIISYRDFMDAAWWITKMFAPVEKEGILRKSESGRYWMENSDIYFTCGSFVEAYLPYYGDSDDLMTWIPTSIEAQNGEYYLTARPRQGLENVRVRIKRA